MSTLTMTLELLLDDFFLWLQRHRSPQTSAATAKKYRRYAERLCEKLGHPARIDAEDLQEWRDTLEKLTPSTINVQIAAIRSLFEYLESKGVVRQNPAKELSMMKVPDRLPKPFTRQEVKAIFNAVYSEEDNLQDRAIMEVLYGSGLRREEAGNLRLGNILDRTRIQVIGKGNKERLTIVTEAQYNALRDWVLSTSLADERSQQIIEEIGRDAAFDELRKRKPEAAVFYNNEGVPLTEHADPGQYIHKRCRVYFEKAGIADGSPHRFRHSFATHLLGNKVDINTVSKFLGHKDLSTTAIYLGTEDQVFEDARHAHPRAG